MPRNPDGTYSRVVNPYEPGADIDAPDVNAEMDDIGKCLTDSISASGSTRINGDISMRGTGGALYKHINVGRGTALTDYADVRSIQENKYVIAIATRTNNVLILTTEPLPAAYTEGMQFFFKSPVAGQGTYESPTTLKIGKLGEKLVLGLIPPDAPIIVTYLKERFHACCVEIGAVLPHNMPNDRLLFFHNGKIAPKSLGEDGDVMPASPELKKLNDLAIQGNEQKILTYGSTGSGTTRKTILTTIDKPGSTLIKPYLGWDNNALVWDSLGSKFVNSIRIKRYDFSHSTQTWTKPPKLHSARITLVAGGGGGGLSNGEIPGLSGGAGETVILYLQGADLTEDEYKIEIGVGGASGESGTGGPGGDTTLKTSGNNTLSKATGGQGGGEAPNNITALFMGADGGTTLDDNRGTLKGKEIIRMEGGQGGPTWVQRLGLPNNRPSAGRGGDSYFGGGGKGKTALIYSATIDGVNGKNGGGGSGCVNSNTPAAGGAGFMIIESWVLA